MAADSTAELHGAALRGVEHKVVAGRNNEDRSREDLRGRTSSGA